MSFCFIHTADWHLGKTFGAFPSELAGELSAARLTAVDRIARVARSHDARGVLVAGDVFDDERLSSVALRRAMNALAAHRDVAWYLMPGNHDPGKAGGLWDRIAGLGPLPENVVVLRAPTPVAFGADAVILPAPLTTRHPAGDPTAWMDHAETDARLARIGLAHGPVQTFSSTADGGGAYRIAPERLRTAGLTYLALGDWHGMKTVAPGVAYSGTPEADRYTDNDPGHVLVVTVDGTSLVDVTPVATGQFTWLGVRHALFDIGERDALATRIVAQAGDEALQRRLVALALSGSLSLAETVLLDRWIEETAGKLRHFEVDRSGITVRPNERDLAQLSASRLLQDTARHLACVADGADSDKADTARLALVRLFAFAAEAEAEAGGRP